jgi:WS/DGAT/MGAT family acyltransferase
VTWTRQRLAEPWLERLSALDASNLRIEDHGVPMHVAALALVGGPSLRDSSGRLDEKALRDHVEHRTLSAPRLRQVLHRTPFAAGPPVWVDDQAFTIGNHVRFHDLGYPADEATMLHVCSDLNKAPLDQTRPLWELWVLTGRSDGDLALLIRLHHVVADGSAALDILGVLFDQTADGPGPRASAKSPGPLPGIQELYADQLSRQVAAASRALASVRQPAAAGRRLLSRLRQVRRLIREGVAPRVSLNKPVGTRRRIVLVRGDLRGAVATAHAHDAKVNDVVLAAMAGGARRLLQSRGELVPDLILRASVAASLRQPGEAVASGNQVGVRFAPLPVGEPDALRRLGQIAAVTAPRRGEPPYQPGGRVLQRWMVRAMFRQRLVNLLVSNLPGPGAPRYFAGAIVRELFQVGVVQGNIPLSVGVISYAGQLNFDIVADLDAVPDLLVFAEGLSAALEELAAVR